MANADYDLVVIGAGSGGLAGAKRAAAHGARVAIVEEDRVGGTCVIRGCIPKKLMVYAAELGEVVSDAEGYGWNHRRGALDWGRLIASRNRAIAELERVHERHLADAEIELVRGHARLVGAHEVDAGGRRLRARYVLIASGATPILPEIPGIEHTTTSDGFFELAEPPGRTVIVGGGYIGVEFASILAGLGFAVSLLVRRDLPLRGFDDDLRRGCADALRAAGVDLRVHAVVERVGAQNGERIVELVWAGERVRLTADRVVVYAVGRRPRTESLGAETVGLELGPHGEIVCDDNGATSVPSIFAVGDVTGRKALTPVAIQAARLLADRLFGGSDATMRYEGIPTAVFCDPPIATVGLTEAEAIARYGEDEVRIFKAAFTPLFHTLTRRKPRTLVKMVVRRSDDRVLGCHMLGRDAPEIIQGLAVAMAAGATKADFDQTVGIHPTSAEEFVTLR